MEASALQCCLPGAVSVASRTDSLPLLTCVHGTTAAALLLQCMRAAIAAASSQQIESMETRLTRQDPRDLRPQQRTSMNGMARGTAPGTARTMAWHAERAAANH